MNSLKYILKNHLDLHHGHCCKDFLHQREDALDEMMKNPDFSQRVCNLFEKLCRDLQNLADEFEGQDVDE